jgi:predicted dithiol-disulfide oxidoreductase (DUF899 family)
MPGTRKVEIRKQTRLFDDFFKVDEIFVAHQSAAFVAIAKAPADRINAWAKQRGWSQIALVSGSDTSYQADYKCQGDPDSKNSDLKFCGGMGMSGRPSGVKSMRFQYGHTVST